MVLRFDFTVSPRCWSVVKVLVDPAGGPEVNPMYVKLLEIINISANSKIYEMTPFASPARVS